MKKRDSNIEVNIDTNDKNGKKNTDDKNKANERGKKTKN